MYDEVSPTPKLLLIFPMETNFVKHYRSGIEAFLGAVFDFEGMKEKEGLASELVDRGLVFGSGVSFRYNDFLATVTFSVSLRHSGYATMVVEEFYKFLQVVRAVGGLWEGQGQVFGTGKMNETLC